MKFARISAQKARLVADQIRGRHVEQALNELQFSTKKGAQMLRKLLESAIANAENNHDLSADSLKIDKAVVEQGPVLKRFKAAARGGVARRKKRMSHIRIVLTDNE